MAVSAEIAQLTRWHLFMANMLELNTFRAGSANSRTNWATRTSTEVATQLLFIRHMYILENSTHVLLESAFPEDPSMYARSPHGTGIYWRQLPPGQVDQN